MRASDLARRESMKNTSTLAALADDLAHGRSSARKLVEECLAKIADPAGEGQRAFIHVDKQAALRNGRRDGSVRKANVRRRPLPAFPFRSRISSTSRDR